jgi:hypothetical protein
MAQIDERLNCRPGGAFEDDIELPLRHQKPVSRVARGGVAAFFVYGVGFGLTYCSQLVIARIVGVDTYGV